MRCLVTGAGGFIGTYLIEFLLGQGHEIFALTHSPSPFLESLKGNLLMIQGDIVDRAFVGQLLKHRKPEIVFHLAAQSLPTVAWEKPEWTFRVNVLGSSISLKKSEHRELPRCSWWHAPAQSMRSVPEGIQSLKTIPWGRPACMPSAKWRRTTCRGYTTNSMACAWFVCGPSS